MFFSHGGGMALGKAMFTNLEQTEISEQKDYIKCSAIIRLKFQ